MSFFRSRRGTAGLIVAAAAVPALAALGFAADFAIAQSAQDGLASIARAALYSPPEMAESTVRKGSAALPVEIAGVALDTSEVGHPRIVITATLRGGLTRSWLGEWPLSVESRL